MKLTKNDYRQYPINSIGWCSGKAETEGHAAFYEGLKKKHNPYPKEDLIGHGFWILGWEIAKGTKH